MNFGFNFGLSAKGSSGGKTSCFTFGTDGTWSGFDSSVPFGSATPDALDSGQVIYSFKFKANGEIRMQFGTAGDEQVPGITNLQLVYSGTESVELTWSTIANDYTTIDTAATAIFLAETEMCFTIQPSPIPPPIPGESYLLDSAGNYLIDTNGNYLVSVTLIL